MSQEMECNHKAVDRITLPVGYGCMHTQSHGFTLRLSSQHSCGSHFSKSAAGI